MEIAGEVQVDRGIARFADAIADYRPVWSVIEDEFYAEEKAQFASEGAEGGEKWAPLSPEYAGWKAVRYPGKPILQRTGSLMKSLTSPLDPNAVRVEGRKQLTLGSKLPYGIYHQSIEPRRVLPRRPEIMLTKQFATASMRHIQAYLVQVATDAGFRTGLGPLQSSKLASIFGIGVAPRGAVGKKIFRGGK